MWICIFDKVMESPIHQFLGEFFGNISSGKNETHCHSSAGQMEVRISHIHNLVKEHFLKEMWFAQTMSH